MLDDGATEVQRESLTQRRTFLSTLARDHPQQWNLVSCLNAPVVRSEGGHLA
jgi:hypothetical protein